MSSQSTYSFRNLLGNKSYQFDVKYLIRKILGVNFSPKNASDTHGYSDMKMLMYLQQIHKKIKRSTSSDDDGSDRAAYRASEVREMLPQDLEVKKYLDFGCGDGKICSAIGKEFRLDRDQTFGTDVAGWMDNSDTITNTITFFFNEERKELPIYDVDLVTCFQVLHHIPEQELRTEIRKIYNCLKPGGTLLLREHDCRDINDSQLIDIEHYLYLAQHDTLSKVAEYYGKYRSTADWDSLLREVGFVSQKITPAYGKTRFYYAIYTKPLPSAESPGKPNEDIIAHLESINSNNPKDRVKFATPPRNSPTRVSPVLRTPTKDVVPSLRPISLQTTPTKAVTPIKQQMAPKSSINVQGRNLQELFNKVAITEYIAVVKENRVYLVDVETIPSLEAIRKNPRSIEHLLSNRLTRIVGPNYSLSLKENEKVIEVVTLKE